MECILCNRKTTTSLKFCLVVMQCMWCM